MTRVGDPGEGLYFFQFKQSQEYRDALATIPPAERGAYVQKLETAFQRLAFLDGRGQVTVDDVRRAAGLEGADAFLGAGDLGALGIAPEMQNALLANLNQHLGSDAKKIGIRLAQDVNETVPGQARLNDGLGAPTSLGKASAVASRMGAASEESLRDYYERFVQKSGQSYDAFVAARNSALTDVTRSGGNLPGFTTSDPEHVNRLNGLGYTLVDSETKAGDVAPTTYGPPTVEHVRGGNDLFALGDFNLSDGGKDKLRAAVARLRAEGASLSRVTVEASTDKVNVTPQLRARLNAYLTQSGVVSPKNDAEDPTGNQRLALARSFAVRQFLIEDAATQVPADALSAPTLRPDQSTNGRIEDPASRYIDVGLEARKPGEAKPGEVAPAETTYTLARPPKGRPLPEVSDHVAFAIDVSPSIDARERVAALQEQLQALERGGFQQVSYDVITFSNRGKPERASFQGTPSEVVQQVARKVGLPEMTTDQIRSFVLERGPTGSDNSKDEPLDDVSAMLRQWRETTTAEGYTPTVIVSTDVDPGRTRELRRQGFLVANPSERDRSAH